MPSRKHSNASVVLFFGVKNQTDSYYQMNFLEEGGHSFTEDPF